MNRRPVFLALFFIFTVTQMLHAQTSTFSYQGRLTEAGNPANGAYQMQFKLFDALAAGSQIGSTITDVPVTVAQGTFAVKLDFGANALSGANRWLEIAIRHNSGESYTTLSPREQIASAPYAVRTLSASTADTATTAATATNALSLGGVAASEYVNNTNIGDKAILNQTIVQATSNFNISGNGFFGNRAGIGTTTPLHRLGLAGGPAWTTHGWGGSMDLENASAIGWRANAGGTRFGMGHSTDGFFMFRTISELGTTTAVPIYDIKIDNAGNIGIGNVTLNTDISQARLNIFSPSLGYGFVQNLGAVTVGSYVDATGGWYGTRSNHPLHFFTNNGLQQMTLLQSGNFGIGTTNPSAKLQVIGAGGVGISVSSQGNALIGTSSGAGFASVFGENTSGSGFGVYGKSTGGFGIYSEGNASQSRDKSGLVKAMIYAARDGAILRCYNGVTGASTGNCGFTINHFANGGYGINFGFQVSDRFVSVAAEFTTVDFGSNAGANFRFGANSSTVDVRTFLTGSTISTSDANFMIIIY